MTASELEPMVKTQEAIIASMQKQLDATLASQQQTARDLVGLQVAVGKLEERLANHIAQTEKWDNRRWGIVGLFIGAIVSLVANLVVALVRK